MTKIDMYWLSRREWWTVKNGMAIVRDDAPKEAQESFLHYLEQTKNKED